LPTFTVAILADPFKQRLDVSSRILSELSRLPPAEQK
jgi:hypothetical protein